MLKQIGTIIRKYRIQSQLTQAQLAVVNSWHINTISNYERGLTKPRPGRLRTLENTFGIPRGQIKLEAESLLISEAYHGN